MLTEIPVIQVCMHQTVFRQRELSTTVTSNNHLPCRMNTKSAAFPVSEVLHLPSFLTSRQALLSFPCPFQHATWHVSAHNSALHVKTAVYWGNLTLIRCCGGILL